MPLLGIFLSILGIIATSVLSIWATLKADRRARHQDRQRQDEQREQDQKAQLHQMEQLLQTMVVEKIEAAFKEIGKLQLQVGAVERSHSHLLGFLQGKGCTVPDFCDTKDPPP
jgi:hypothetical protein